MCIRDRQRGDHGKHVAGHEPALEFAWRIFNAQQAWIEGVDRKATALLFIESAVIGILVATHAQLLVQVGAWRFTTAFAGVVVWFASGLLTLLSTIPMLGRSGALRKESKNYFMYFGHVRHWRTIDLEKRLRDLTADDALKQLAFEIITVSNLVWRKHRLLQAAMLTGIVGGALVVASLLIPS